MCQLCEQYVKRVSYVNSTAARDREFCVTESKRSDPVIVMPAGLVPVSWVRCCRRFELTCRLHFQVFHVHAF